jgi:hypothetical protein
MRRAPTRIASSDDADGGPTTQTDAVTFDGSLLKSIDQTGAANGKFSLDYDNDFLPTHLELTSGGTTKNSALAFDQDELLTTFGPFTYVRSGPGARVASITTSGASVASSYDSLARTTSRTHTVSGAQVYKLDLGYDAAGRTVQRTDDRRHAEDADPRLRTRTAASCR